MAKGRDGFSLIELVIAMVILVIVVVITFMLLFTSSETYESQSTHLVLDNRARETLNQIVEDLRASRLNTLASPPATAIVPDDDATYTDLSFRVPGTFDLQAYAADPDSVVNQTIRYRWVIEPTEEDDGADNDRDGLVDEGMVEKTDRFGVTTRICWGVAENGLSFKVPTGGTGRVQVTLRLQAIEPTDQKLLMREQTTTAELRN